MLSKFIVGNANSLTSRRLYHKVLTKESLSEQVKNAEYAVRGKIPLRGEEIQNEINKGSKSFAFSNTTALNIGNPQAVGQGHLSFNREVKRLNFTHYIGTSSTTSPRLVKFNCNQCRCKRKSKEVLKTIRLTNG